MRSERKKQIHLHFSEPQGRKAHAVGLKRKTFKIAHRHSEAWHKPWESPTFNFKRNKGDCHSRSTPSQ